jgi:hypothetical protein
MNIRQDGITSNAARLLWAGFVAILATGVGFGVRGGILANWGAEFGFTGAELGAITGAGLTGFCFGIIIGGLVVDQLGYGRLIVAAFVFHALSAFVTFGAGPGQEKAVAYNFLYWGTFIFAIANGTLEAVANPLVATLFPNKRTHYLNILLDRIDRSTIRSRRKQRQSASVDRKREKSSPHHNHSLNWIGSVGATSNPGKLAKQPRFGHFPVAHNRLRRHLQNLRRFFDA